MSTITADDIEEMNKIHWWHRILIGKDESGNEVYTPGEVNHGPNGGDWPTTRFGLPTDCSGLSVVDIGGWDGFFAFEAERRNAKSVLVVDAAQEDGGNWGGTKGFEFAKKILKSKVDFQRGDLSKKSITDFGEFDLVLCFGVLYHMRNPWTAFEHLYSLTKPGGRVVIETALTPDKQIVNSKTPAWAFHPKYVNDPTNYWYPNLQGVASALSFTGYTNVKQVYAFDPPIRATHAAVR